MWWGQYSGQPLWLRVFLIIIIIAVATEFFSGRNGGWGWWVLFPVFFFIVPAICRQVMNANGNRKRKNDEYGDEKPKRYVTGEDGEGLEVIEEAAPPRRKQKPDDIEYV